MSGWYYDIDFEWYGLSSEAGYVTIPLGEITVCVSTACIVKDRAWASRNVHEMREAKVASEDAFCREHGLRVLRY